MVKEYLETLSKEKCWEKLEDVIHLFCIESIWYFDDILDAAVYDNIFCSVSCILIREKKGLDADNFSESLQKLVTQDCNSNISKAVCNRAMMWLQSAGILDFARKITELGYILQDVICGSRAQDNVVSQCNIDHT